MTFDKSFPSRAEAVAGHCSLSPGPALTDRHDLMTLHSALAPEWQITPDFHLQKAFVSSNFIETAEFALKIARLAEEENHHPELRLSGNTCYAELQTHSAGGLTINDFILAAKMDNLS